MSLCSHSILLYAAAPKVAAGTWTSNIRFVDPVSLETLGVHALDANEMAVSATLVTFSTHVVDGVADLSPYLAVGLVKDWVLATQSFSAAYIAIYRLMGDGPRKTALELVHKTDVKHVPYALTAFQVGWLVRNVCVCGIAAQRCGVG